MKKPHLSFSKFYQTFQSDRIKEKEQLFFWGQVQISNMIWIKIPIRKPAFEFELNLLEAQTCLETYSKFPKIRTCLDLPECEFRMV
jgi:hypothetical protein